MATVLNGGTPRARPLLRVLGTLLVLGQLVTPTTTRAGCCGFPLGGGCYDTADSSLCGVEGGTFVSNATCDPGTHFCVVSEPTSTTTTTLPTAPLTKTDGGHKWGSDPLIRYQIIAASHDSAAGGLVLHETVPVGTTFSKSASSAGWTCSMGPDEGNACTLALGDLAPGTSRTVTFSARVANGTDRQFEIYNEATATTGTSGSGSGISPRALGLLGSASACTSADPIAVPCIAEVFFCAAEARLIDIGVPPCGLGYCGLPGSAPEGRSLMPASLSKAFNSALPYRIRDRVLHTTHGGRRATLLYYRYSPDLVQAVAANPALLDLGWAALLAWQPHLEALVADQGDSVTVTQEESSAIEAFLDALQPVASPALQQAMALERPLLNVPAWPGLTLNAALGQLDRLRCESAVTIGSVRCRIDEVAGLVDANTAAGSTQKRLDGALVKAGAGAQNADGLLGRGKTKKGHAALGKVVGALRGFEKRVRSKRAGQDIAADVRQSLLAAADALLTDLVSLRKAP